MSSYIYYQTYSNQVQQIPSMSSINGYGYYQPPIIPPNYYSSHTHRNSFGYHPPAMQYIPPPSTSISSGIQVPISIPVSHKEQVNGGVSEVLDYDLNIMTDFVVKNALSIFGNKSLSPSIIDIFAKGILSVLNATRLPSTTVFLALNYLVRYLNKLSNGLNSIGGDSINVIYQNLMIAFILANKFNDDKTFTNNSWSQATGMKIGIINEYEKEWLTIFEWKLFEDKFETYGSYIKAWKTFVRENSSLHPFTFFTPYTKHYCTSNHQQSYYSSPLSQQSYQTPPHVNSGIYSSPPYSDQHNTSFNKNYMPYYSSPILTNHSVSNSNRDSYYAPVAVNSLWNTQKNSGYIDGNNSAYYYSTTY